MPTQRTRQKTRREPADAKSLERAVRQLLADKISGNQVGIWLLMAEHLRLGTWDLLCRWTNQGPEQLEPRLALHLIHEAAMCVRHLRHGRSLSQKGFELANGLPFVPTDQVIHDLLEARTIADSQNLQIALGKLRRASNHFQGQVLALDPHRMKSFSKRQMRRHRLDGESKATKMGQCFFCLDTDTHQPLCFVLNSSSPNVTQVTPELLKMTRAILDPLPDANKPLVLADKEYLSTQLMDEVAGQGDFDLLVAMPNQPALQAQCARLPARAFKTHWPGYAIAKKPYHLRDSPPDKTYYHLVQRTGAKAPAHQFNSFLATANRPPLPDLTVNFPKRWHIEEFFKFNQALGWDRTGTLNLNVRYGQMTMSLLAQGLIHQLRQRMGKPYSDWDANHLARQVFEGLDGDIRVSDDTILVTYYNAPNADKLRLHYENLPDKLADEGISSAIPWLYNFKLDFRFK